MPDEIEREVWQDIKEHDLDQVVHQISTLRYSGNIDEEELPC
jgi:hypothetical protein